MTRHGDPWWSLFRPRRRRKPAPPSVALDVHLRVLRRKIEESDWTHDDIREQTGWSRAYLFAILHRLRPLRVEDLFAVLEAIDVAPGVYFEQVCRELAEIDGG